MSCARTVTHVTKFVVLIIVICTSTSFAVTPQFWQESTQQQFSEGDPQAVSITSDGELLLSPQMKKIYEGSDSIIWKIVRDGESNIYAATGNEGKILKIDSTGKAITLLDTEEIEVQDLALDSQGNVYAATHPDGKIYRIKRDGTSEVFFDPPEKYIWSLTFDDAGNLYAATGHQGRIYKIDSQGKGKVFVDTAETNITSLAWGSDQSLLAGSDQHGILFRIDASGRAFVLYDSDQEEISSIYVAPGGEVFFATISGIRPAPGVKPPPPVPPPTGSVSPETGTFTEETDVVASVEVTTSIATPQIVASAKPVGASHLYRMNADATIEYLYSTSEEQILEIAGVSNDNVLLSTGKKAKLIQLDKSKKSTILLKASEEQITSLITGSATVIATANPGNIYQLIENHATQGVYYSPVRDAVTVSSWGRLSWKGEVPEGTTVKFSTRSGNTITPDETWSPWQSAGEQPAGQQISSPKARFIQWKADFTTNNSAITPLVRSITIPYLQQNLRPVVNSITIHPAGTVFKKTPIFPQESFAGMPEPLENETSQQVDLAALQTMDLSLAGKKEFRRGFQTISWNSADQNQDRLSYDLFYKSPGEKNWKPLAKGVKETVFTWDTQTIPDGTYLMQVVVNDSPSNPKDYALTSTRESAPFDVDNSAPVIEVSKSGASKPNVVHVTVRDQFSPIQKLEYSVTPGVWNIVFPVDSINDSPTENYSIEIKDLTAEMTNLVLKASDKLGNTTTIRHSLR